MTEINPDDRIRLTSDDFVFQFNEYFGTKPERLVMLIRSCKTIEDYTRLKQQILSDAEKAEKWDITENTEARQIIEENARLCEDAQNQYEKTLNDKQELKKLSTIVDDLLSTEDEAWSCYYFVQRWKKILKTDGTEEDGGKA